MTSENENIDWWFPKTRPRKRVPKSGRPEPSEARANLIRNAVHRTLGRVGENSSPRGNQSLFRAAQNVFNKPDKPTRQYALPQQDLLAINERVDRNQGFVPKVPTPDSPDTPGGGSPSVGSNFGGDVLDMPVVDPNAEYRNALLARLQEIQGQTMPLYGDASKAIRGIYEGTSKDLREAYGEGFNPLKAGANSLGFGGYFSDDPNVRMFDAAARKLQETSDLNLANDLSWNEKMQAQRGDIFKQLQMAIELGQFDPEVDTSGGGGGGGFGGRRFGGRGGGGGGDDEFGDINETITEDTTFYNPGLANAISGIGDEGLRAYLDNIYAGSGATQKSALQEAVRRYNEATKFVPDSPISRNTVAGSGPLSGVFNLMRQSQIAAQREQNKRREQMASQAMDFFKNWSPGYQPQVTKTTGKVQSKKKTSRATANNNAARRAAAQRVASILRNSQ